MRAAFLLVFALINVEVETSLPNYIKQCYRNDPGLSNCIRENLEFLKTIYSKGPIPELGIVSLDPAVNPEKVYNLLGFYFPLTNIQLWHLDDYTINSVEFGLTNFNVDFFYPSLGIKTHYKAQGKLLTLELDSEGDVVGNYTAVPIKYQATLDTVIRNGEQYLNLKSSELECTMEKYNIHFTQLFKFSVMNELANGVINMNQNLILKQFTPFIEEIVKYVFDGIIRNLFEQYSLDQLLPEKI